MPAEAARRTRRGSSIGAMAATVVDDVSVERLGHADDHWESEHAQHHLSGGRQALRRWPPHDGEQRSQRDEQADPLDIAARPSRCRWREWRAEHAAPRRASVTPR